MVEQDSSSLQTLFIEDNLADVRLIQEMLKDVDDTAINLIHVDCLQAGLARLRSGSIDVILTDLGLSDAHGLEVFLQLHDAFPTIPIVVLTGTYLEMGIGLEAVRLGAQDYLIKGQINGPALLRILRYALERKKRTELEKTNEELRHFLQMKAEFTAVVSHEFRTPLAAMQEAIALILDGITGPITKDQEEHLRIALSNIHRLSHMVENVLSFSHLELGKFQTTFRKTNLSDLVKEMYQFLKPLAIKRDIDFVMNLPSQPLQAFCDGNGIKQVIGNLVYNAFKFTPKRGKVTLTLTSSPSHIRIEVEDTGIGISEEDQQKIFELFRKRANSGMWTPQGLGLGLLICKHIITEHQGTMAVKSILKKGSAFIASFPLKKP